MAVRSDSERFQGWLQDTFEARQRISAETISMGPFRAILHPDRDPPAAWVTLVDTDGEPEEGRRALARLRSAFDQHHFTVEIEYDDHAFPHARAWFDELGLKLEELVPLMACRPETFRPFAAPGVSITRLSDHGRPPELEAFQRIRWTDGGDLEREIPDLSELRAGLGDRSSVFLLAWLDWEPVGTGVSHLTRDAAEIVGVVTRNDRRRRGVAGTVTSELIVRHFDSGGDFVFLEAATEAAVSVYERLGFTRFGVKALYR